MALPLGLLATLVCTVLSSATLAEASPPTARVAASARVDTGSRESVAALWRSEWLPATRSKVSLYGGSDLLCLPYQTSPATLATMLRALNFARGLSGVPPLTSLTDSSGAARSALIQVVNRVLDHSPGRGLSCYSPAGAHAARRSDLGLWGYSTKTWRPTISTVVNAYLTDPGGSNADAAHRLWLLRSAARKLTTGFAVNHSGGWTWVSNSTVVFPNSGDVPGGPKFHAWPGAGYFPIQLEPRGRWSLSAASPRIGFKHAKIRVTRNGHKVKVRRKLATTVYGDNSLTWQLASRPRLGRAKTATYCVKVTGIGHSKPYSWCTYLFRP